MTSFDPETLSVDDLEVVVNPCDVRRDLHTFVTYFGDHGVTRTYRENLLPKNHALRLAKRLTDPEAAEEIKAGGQSEWLDYVDRLGLQLKLVRYNTKGVYVGYSSSSESYPDNDVFFEDSRYERFLRLSLQAQEARILSALLNDCGYDKNEFLEAGPFSRLDRFDYSGCAAGVMPTLRFAKVRRYLLDLLAQCESGVWYSVASLVEHLKANDPFFLIQEALPKEVRAFERERYHNFTERPRGEWSPRTKIRETDPRAFERVEGRFVERFLEGIPLAMGYLDVAYAKQDTGKIAPSLGLLQAFRLTSRFFPAIREAIPEPKVTVLPNFEVHIESAFYPAAMLAALTLLGDVAAEDVHTVLKLDKQKVARTAAEDPGADVPGVLRELAANAIPANVERELQSWVGRSENFVLYEGFGLLEGNIEALEARPFVVERISPSLAVVATPRTLHDSLEAAERIPIVVRHTESALRPAPEGAASVFAVKRRKAAIGRKRAAIVKRSVRITLHFPTRGLFDAFLKTLLDAQCVLPSDARAMTFSYSKEQEKAVASILREFKKKHAVRLEEIA